MIQEIARPRLSVIAAALFLTSPVAGAQTPNSQDLSKVNCNDPKNGAICQYMCDMPNSPYLHTSFCQALLKQLQCQSHPSSSVCIAPRNPSAPTGPVK